MTQSPVKIFDSIHSRALRFVAKGAGPKRRDELRAAVVFSAAAIDAYFHTKVVQMLLDVFDKSRTTAGFSPSAIALLKNSIALKNFDKEYTHLRLASQKQMVDSQIKNFRSDSLANYLQDAIGRVSFLTLDKMEYGFNLMGASGPQIWNTLKKNWSTPVALLKKGPGRPVSKRRGPKIQAQVQLDYLFRKRHQIVHEGDVNLRGKKYYGHEKSIAYTNVKRWLEYSHKTIHEIDILLKNFY